MNKRRKRILLWYWGRRGGGPRYAYELARAMIENGDFDLYLSLSRQSEIFSEFEALDLPGLPVETYTTANEAALASLRLPFIRRAFWRYVRENRIDMVICTMSHLWDVPVLLARPKEVPYLMVLHDALPHPGDDIFLRHWLLKTEIGRADGIVTLTEHVRKLLCDGYGYPRNLSWVVPHGVFPYAQTIDKVSPPGMPKTLLFFGRLLPYKGLDLLLDALALLHAQGREVNLLISGPGDAAPYRAQLDKLSGVTLDNRWIPEEEIGAIFLKADICVLPYREASQSGVIATAYAAGMPVVTTPIGGLVEQVRHELTGLICESASPAAIAASIARLLDAPDLLAACAEGAAREARESLAWPAIARRFGAVIENLLDLKSKAGNG